jgi:NIPSNAP protein
MLRKYRVTAGLIALAFGVGYFAGRESPVAAQSKNRLLEIRTYVTPDKTGLDALVNRMRSEKKIFDRLGMKSVAFFVAAEPPKSENTFIYILAHENRERAKENWSKFGPDPEWKDLLSKSAPTGQLKIESVFVTPTDFSPVK